MKLREEAKNIQNRQKGPVSKRKWNTTGWQLCYLPRFKSSHKTFSGHHYDVKGFWAPLWARRRPTFCLLDFIFQPLYTGRLTRGANFHCKCPQACVIHLSPSVCFLLLFFGLKKNLSKRAMNSLIIEVWEDFFFLDEICYHCDSQLFTFRRSDDS